MKPVKNFKEYINSNLAFHFFMYEVAGGWRMKVDTDGWLWVHPTNQTAPTCLRFHFDWLNEKAVMHIIPKNHGTKYKHELVVPIQPENFQTFNHFIEWIKCNIRARIPQIVWDK